ncbi:MAG: hypothetical protein J5I52_06865 [Saprospiraceae bacterium]|nr:hypothetical protein [Saprospiraceae bacterium]
MNERQFYQDCPSSMLAVRCNPTDDRADINRLTEKRTDQAHPPPDKTTI